MSQAGALQAARERQAELRGLIVDAYACLTHRRYGVAVLKLEEAMKRADAVEWYLQPDEGALDRLVAAAAVTRELCVRLQLRATDQAAEVLRAAVDLRARIHLGER